MEDQLRREEMERKRWVVDASRALHARAHGWWEVEMCKCMQALCVGRFIASFQSPTPVAVCGWVCDGSYSLFSIATSLPRIPFYL